MKSGDLVKFINKNHTSYYAFKDSVGVVLEVDMLAKFNRHTLDQHLGAKVTVAFNNRKPDICSEAHLEIISES